MSQEMAVCANLLNADRQAFIKAMLTKRGESGSTLTVICGRAILFCFAFFQLGRCPMTEAGWTHGKDVKVEGWYWWEVEEETGLSLKVVQVEKGFTWIENEGRDVLYVVGYGGLLENKPGRFKGPITPDSYQQGRVAGLREAIQRADEMGNQSSSSHVRSVVGLKT